MGLSDPSENFGPASMTP